MAFIRKEKQDGSVEFVAENYEELAQIGLDFSNNTPALNITPDELQRILAMDHVRECEKYLADTDWYASRKTETGAAIPQEVLDKRQECRDFISANRV